MENRYRICLNCVMDSSDPDIIFDSEGVCNHCYEMRKRVEKHKSLNIESIRFEIVKKIKNAGVENNYDCLIGLSGGVDSSYLAVLLKNAGLKPLAVHLDNGWNSELAVKNIENILSKLSIDLVTHVLDWEEFKDIQLSFLKASVPDLEIPTDHAINAILYQIAASENIKYIVLGTNFASETILPKAWSQGHFDWAYIRKIQKTFGTKKIKKFPHLTVLKLFYYKRIKKIEIVSYLDLVEYNKEEARNILKSKYSWKDYGGKHHESFYTKFYQTYILPVKFGFDKRRAHLSSLINSGQIDRGQALNELEKPLISNLEAESGKEYVSKKFGLSLEEFNNLLQLKNKKYSDYRSSNNLDTLDLENTISKYIFFPKRILKYISKKYKNNT